MRIIIISIVRKGILIVIKIIGFVCDNVIKVVGSKKNILIRYIIVNYWYWVVELLRFLVK